MQNKVEYDLGTLLTNVLEAFSVWEEDREAVRALGASSEMPYLAERRQRERIAQ